MYSGQCEVLINLPAAEESDEDAEHVTGVDRSSADDELRPGCSLRVRLAGGGGGDFFFTADVPATKQKTEDWTYVRHLELVPAYLPEVIKHDTSIRYSGKFIHIARNNMPNNFPKVSRILRIEVHL